MSISKISDGEGNGASEPLTCAEGDWLIVFAADNTSEGPPSLASGFSGVIAAQSGQCAIRVGMRQAPAGGLSSTGTWTGAEYVTWIILRSSTGDPLAIGDSDAFAITSTSSTIITYPACTRQQAGISWILAGCVRVNASGIVNNAPSGLTNHSFIPTPAGTHITANFSSNGIAGSDFAQTNVTGAGVGSRAIAVTFEVYESSMNPPQAPTLYVEYGDDWAQLSTTDFIPHADEPLDEHDETQWQITTADDEGFDTPVVDVTSSVFLYEFLADGTLTAEVEYVARARHIGTLGGESGWSGRVFFTTDAAITKGDTPSLSLVEKGTSVSAVSFIEVQVSVFNHPDGDTEPPMDSEAPLSFLAHTEFQIRLASDPNWNTPLDAVAVTYTGDESSLRILFDDLSPNTAYKFRARQLDGYLGAYTLYSSDLSVTTDATPADAPTQPTITVVTCGRTIEVTGTAFGHTTSGVHTSSQWAICSGGRCQSITTSSELLSFSWPQVGPGSYTLKVRYKDELGRWGAYSATEPCEVPGYPEVVVFTHPAIGAVISTSQTVTWEVFDPEAVGWHFDGELSTDLGESWVTIFTDQISQSYIFSVTGRPNGDYLIRVRARNPDTDELGDWAVLPFAIDRTGSRSVHYHFADFDEFPDTWRQIWSGPEHIGWGFNDFVDTDTGQTLREGIIAGRMHTGTTVRRSGLVFDEFGEPDEFDLTVTFQLDPSECQGIGWRFTNLTPTRPGSMIFGVGGSDRAGRLSLMSWNEAWYLGSAMICASQSLRDGAGTFTTKHAKNNPATAWQYGRSMTRGSFRTVTNRVGDSTDVHTHSTITAPGDLDPQVPIGGPHVYTQDYRDEGLMRDEEGNPLARRLVLYTMTQRVRRGVSGGNVGWNISTQIWGPGIAHQGTSQFLREVSASGDRITCGAVGLGFEDMDSIGPGRAIGALFTDFSLRVLSYGSCVAPLEVGCEADWDFTIFEDDDVTPWYGSYDGDRLTGTILEADFYSERTCPRPYLKEPEDFSEQEINYAQGRGVLGAVKVGVVDKRLTADDQTTGIVTARISEAIGRRAVLRRWREDLGMVTVFDGVIESYSMDEQIVTYWFNLRDPRERERDIEMFTRNETFSVYPEPGPIENYGALPGGGYILPAVRIDDDAGFLRPITSPANGVHHGLFLCTDMSFANFSQYVLPLATRSWDPATGMEVYGEYTIRWRPQGGDDDDWVYVRNSPVPNATVLHTIEELSNDFYVYAASLDSDDLPDNSDTVEMQILASKTTETTPYIWDGGTFGDLANAALSGEFTENPPNFRYSESEFATWAEDTGEARFIAREPAKDLREWMEKNVYAATAHAPSFDADMREVPSAWELPPADEELVELDMDWIIPVGDWSDSTSSVLNRVKYTYIKEHVLPPEEADSRSTGGAWWIPPRPPTHSTSFRWERFMEERVVVDTIHAASATLFGPKPIEYEPVTARSWGFIENIPATLLFGGGLGARLADKITSLVMGRYTYGAAEYVAGVRSGMAHGPTFDPYTLDLQNGQWIKARVSHLPEYSTGQRNLYRYMQIKSLADPKIDHRRLRLEDGGPVIIAEWESGEAEDLLSMPSFGVVFETNDHRIQAPVFEPTDAPADATLRVDYAENATEPSESSGLWIPFAFLDDDGDAITPVFLAGTEVWIRARTEAPNRRPSEWNVYGSVTLQSTPGLTEHTIELDDDGEPTITWAPNAFTEGLRIDYSIGAFNHTPSYTTFDEIDSDSPLTFTLTGLVVDEDEEIVVRIKTFSGWTGSAVSGTEGQSYILKAQRAAEDAGGGGSSDFLGLSDTPDSYSGQAGLAVVVNEAEDGLEFVQAGETAAGACVTDTSVASATTTPTAITWTTEVFDDAGFFDSGANTRFTVPTGMGGLYIVRCVVRGNNDTSAHRLSLALRLNGTTTIEPQGYQAKSDAASSFGAQVRVEILHRLADGDYVEALLSANATTDMLDTDNAFWICRVGGPAVVAGTFDSGGSGTSFPGSPATGALFWRTDRNIQYVYDGTRWLSTQIFVHQLWSTVALNATATATVARASHPWTDTYDIYVEKAWFNHLLSGTGNWTLSLQKVNTSGTGTEIASSGAFSTTNRTQVEVTVNAVVPTSDNIIDFLITATENSGTATLSFGFGSFTYRLVG